MKREIYSLAVVLTSISLFWPVLYNLVSKVVKLPGNPLFQAVCGVILFGTVAYLTFDEGITAS